MIERILIAIVLAAAVSTTCLATEVTDDQISTLQIGTTTYDQVVSQFGKPSTVETSSDGKSISYIETHTHIKGATFIPLVGLFAGGAKAESRTVKLEFGADGLLKKTSTTETNINCKTFGGCK